MENDNSNKNFESVYSSKVRAGKRRTYFFDVRKTKGEDFYITLTESTKKFNGTGYERHKLFLYKEDFNRFIGGLEDVVNHVKTELMPDYDYDEYTRRQEEWERKKAEEDAAAAANEGEAPTEEKVEEVVQETTEVQEAEPEVQEAEPEVQESEPEAKAEEEGEVSTEGNTEAEDEDISW